MGGGNTWYWITLLIYTVYREWLSTRKWNLSDNTLALSEFKPLGKGKPHPMILKGLSDVTKDIPEKLWSLGEALRGHRGDVFICRPWRSRWPLERWCHLVVKIRHPGVYDRLGFRFQLLITPCGNLGKSLNLFGLYCHLEMVMHLLTTS